MSPTKVALVGADNERTHETVVEFKRLAAEAGGDADIVRGGSGQPQAGVGDGTSGGVEIGRRWGATVPAAGVREAPGEELVQTRSAGAD